jgi:hypothetical protein
MNFFWKKIKLFTSGLLVILYILAISLNSCNPKNTESEGTEQGTEHPAEDAQEHPADNEHPADSVSESEEHPSDSAGEHPDN